MMKQKIIKPNRGAAPEVQEKPCNPAESNSAEEMDALMYWLAYSYPFMPIIDFSMVFAALIKMVKNWFLPKREHKIICKKKTDETL